MALKAFVVATSLIALIGTIAIGQTVGPSGGSQYGTSTTAAASAGAATTSATGTTTSTTPTKTKHAAAAKSAKGSVASVDDTAKSFTIHPKIGSDWTFKTNEKTTYWFGKKKGTWADVKQGSDVTVYYKNDGTDNWATRVKIAEPVTAPPAKTGSK